ncbi:MAG: trypsin-like peptidase domain-containing protein [Xanthomonadaceae bacterium]|nr:trypsin-like peptidase domain-containing protein [Xanthomonadaceae bacterium]
MKILLTLLLALGSAQSSFSQSKPPKPKSSNLDIKVIYGEDNRQDLYQLKPDSDWRTRVTSTVALMDKDTLQFDNAGNALLPDEMVGDQMNFCQEEPFYEQLTAAFCSGSLVAKDIILTAGHCVKDQQDCDNLIFAFGYQMDGINKHPLKIPGKEVYGCSKIIDRKQDNNGADWALVRLTKAVPAEDHKPLEMELTPVKSGTELVVIGHPSGMPVKIAGGAKVRRSFRSVPGLSGYFTSNLDTYGGNSGSAVFNRATGKVVGVLVRGENDYSRDDSRDCNVSNKCAEDGCRGEDATTVASFINQLERARKN